MKLILFRNLNFSLFTLHTFFNSLLAIRITLDSISYEYEIDVHW
jgi:hypothetical protein